VFDSLRMTAQCTCSRERVASVLNSFPAEERASMVDNNRVAVTCEFCGRLYEFEPAEIAA